MCVCVCECTLDLQLVQVQVLAGSRVEAERRLPLLLLPPLLLLLSRPVQHLVLQLVQLAAACGGRCNHDPNNTLLEQKWQTQMWAAHLQEAENLISFCATGTRFRQKLLLLV